MLGRTSRRIKISFGYRHECNREWNGNQKGPSFRLPYHAVLYALQASFPHRNPPFKQLPPPRLPRIMIDPRFTTIVISRPKNLHFDRPFRLRTFIVYEIDVQTFEHGFVVVICVVLRFPRVVLSGMHSVQEDAETLRGCYDVGCTKPPLKRSKYTPPARVLRKSEDDGNGKAYGDVRDSENTESDSPFFIAIAY